MAGRWDPFDVVEISGQTVGIVGYGDIGRAVRDARPRSGDARSGGDAPRTAALQYGSDGEPDLRRRKTASK